MEEFTASKRVQDIIEFDKEHHQFRLLLNEGSPVIQYQDLKSCGASIEQHKKSAESVVTGIFTFASVGSAAQGTEYVRVGIKLELQDDTNVFAYVSHKVIQRGTLEYHEDVQKAREVCNLLWSIIHRREH